MFRLAALSIHSLMVDELSSLSMTSWRGSGSLARYNSLIVLDVRASSWLIVAKAALNAVIDPVLALPKRLYPRPALTSKAVPN